MTKDKYTNIVDLMTPRASVLTMMSYCENAIISFKKQTILVYSNDDQGRLYQNCKKYYHKGRNCCSWVCGCDHTGDIIKMLDLVKLFYSTPGCK